MDNIDTSANAPAQRFIFRLLYSIIVSLQVRNRDSHRAQVDEIGIPSAVLNPSFFRPAPDRCQFEPQRTCRENHHGVSTDSPNDSGDELLTQF